MGTTGLRERGSGGVDQCSCHKQPFASPAIAGTHYLHGWKARRQREQTTQHLGAPLRLPRV